jgi:hypothetical protein
MFLSRQFIDNHCDSTFTARSHMQVLASIARRNQNIASEARVADVLYGGAREKSAEF